MAIVEAIAKELEGNDREFLGRVWGQDPEVYRERLRSIGFTSRRRVLDAGADGPVGALPRRAQPAVDAVDWSAARVDVSGRLLAAAGRDNVRVQHGSIEQLPFPDAAFDAVFCYSVVYVSDYGAAWRSWRARSLRKACCT